MDQRRPIRAKGYYKQVKVAQSFLIILLVSVAVLGRLFVQAILYPVAVEDSEI